MKRGDRNKRVVYIILAIVAALIVLGFLLGAVVESSTMFCTLMACYPHPESTGVTEVPCNGCGVKDYVFVTGFFNVYKQCSAKEILVFNGQEYIETKYEISECSEVNTEAFKFRV